MTLLDIDAAPKKPVKGRACVVCNRGGASLVELDPGVPSVALCSECESDRWRRAEAIRRAGRNV